MASQIPLLLVDFNEMLDFDLVLLSRDDVKADAGGNPVHLYEGMAVDIYSDDGAFDDGRPSALLARGVVERNRTEGWSKHVKWACRIDQKGVHHVELSQLTQHEPLK